MFVIPYRHREEIDSASNEFGIDRVTIVTVINIESSFDKNAKSNAGAVGLMQLLPSTAKEICQKLNIDFNESDLLIPEINIRLGTYYLKYLLDYYGGNWINTLSAYNWGLTNVNNWIAKGNIDDSGSITNIPVDETNDYIKKYHSYKKMYSFFYNL